MQTSDGQLLSWNMTIALASDDGCAM